MISWLGDVLSLGIISLLATLPQIHIASKFLCKRLTDLTTASELARTSTTPELCWFSEAWLFETLSTLASIWPRHFRRKGHLPAQNSRIVTISDAVTNRFRLQSSQHPKAPIRHRKSESKVPWSTSAETAGWTRHPTDPPRDDEQHALTATAGLPSKTDQLSWHGLHTYTWHVLRTGSSVNRRIKLSACVYDWTET